MKPAIAIVGYGRFGRLISHHLKRRYSVGIVEPRRCRTEAGVRQISLAEAANREAVILAVPIRRMRSVLSRLSPLLRPGSLVIDVCSVKEMPVAWMKELLPADVSILAMHPLFGPDSAAEGLRDRSIVLCPVRLSRRKSRCVRRQLKALGLRTFVMTPREHDRLMASGLFIAQLTGRVLSLFLKKLPSPATQSVRFLHSVVTASIRDTSELFIDMYRYNRFSRNVPQRFLTEANRILRMLRKKRTA